MFKICRNELKDFQVYENNSNMSKSAADYEIIQSMFSQFSV